MARQKRILVLIHQPQGDDDKNWHDFHQKMTHAMGADVTITMGALVDLTFVLTRQGLSIYDFERGFQIDDFDLVVFRNIKKDFIRASACVSLLRARGITYIDSRLEPRPLSKFCAQAIRFNAGMPIIPSLFSTPAELLRMIRAKDVPFPYPIIIKDDNGKKGQNNFLAHTPQEAEEIITRHPDVSFLIQEYIAGDGDYRFLVMGHTVVFVLHRRAQGASHLNNTSRGAESQVIPVENFSKAVIDTVVQAAQLEHTEVAGVDVIFDAHSAEYYVIEVNSSPQVTTGAFPELKVAALARYFHTLLSY